MDTPHRLALRALRVREVRPGRLSAQEEARYWQECATAAELQTIDPGSLPRSRDEVRAYFAAMRPRLAASESTQAAMDHLLNADVIFPALPRALRPGAWVAAKAMRMAVIATLPRWQRRLAGLRQPRAVDVAVRPLMRLSFRIAALSPRLQVLALRLISPATVPVAGPAVLGLEPRRPETLTPAEAFERHGVPTPAELYAQLAPSDADEVALRPSSPAAPRQPTAAAA